MGETSLFPESPRDHGDRIMFPFRRRRSLLGMHVVITGASAGIGEALARSLAEQGARLALIARREDRLHALVRGLPARSGEHAVIPADVGNVVDCRRAMGAVLTALGRVDTLVCNAGIGLWRPVSETTEDEWLHLMRVNVLGTTACMRVLLPVMRQQPLRDGWRGQVMVVSSCLARRSPPQGAAYAATKAAQLSLCESLRVEEAGHGIAVTSVHPIGTRTEFFVEAERRSQGTAEPRSPIMQDAWTVARAMTRGIARPRPEVWPFAPSRWLFAMNGWWPGLFDRFFAKT
jgi:NAD(P)-dependent dehydrogenase (short-subunit alcohol dehydrogenase family)